MIATGSVIRTGERLGRVYLDGQSCSGGRNNSRKISTVDSKRQSVGNSMNGEEGRGQAITSVLSIPLRNNCVSITLPTDL